MKILCLDGGGVFGIGQAMILSKIDALEKFDCFVGTSIGSAIAMATVLGQSNQVSPEFFHKWMPVIFKKSLLRYYWPFNSKYNGDGLDKALKELFRGATMADVQKPLFVTSANVGSKTLKVFSSESDKGWMAWEVVRSATSAETYFPSWKGFADGGVFANNPSMVGIAAASKVLGVDIADMEVLSIGTGDRTVGTSKSPSSVFGWGEWLIGAMLDGASDKMHDYFARSMPLKRYERIQFAGNGDWKMDSVEDMLKAEAAWRTDVIKAVKIVENF